MLFNNNQVCKLISKAVYKLIKLILFMSRDGCLLILAFLAFYYWLGFNILWGIEYIVFFDGFEFKFISYLFIIDCLFQMSKRDYYEVLGIAKSAT